MNNSYSGVRAMHVQVSRLFGTTSKVATRELKTDKQWKDTLRKVLKELEQYILANVDADDLQMYTLMTGIAAATQALTEDDFWPGYVQGITRISLILLGSYPDHRKRKPGRKRQEFYKLDRERTLGYQQTPHQRLLTFMSVGRMGFLCCRRTQRMYADVPENVRFYNDAGTIPGVVSAGAP